MPLNVATTTIPLIQAAFVTALERLTPRSTRAQLDGWKYRGTQTAKAGLGNRWFHFEWDNDGLTPGGFMYNEGASVDVTCSIVADYNLPEHELDAIAHDDHWQVRDVLDLLRNTTDGLRRVQSLDWARSGLTNESTTRIQVIHQYTVSYVLAKAV